MKGIQREQVQQIDEILGFSPIFVYNYADEEDEPQYIFTSPYNPAETKRILQELLSNMSDVG